MNIAKVLTTQSINILSGLSNNSDSIIPMAVKDGISNCAVVATYKKHGGKDDANERIIEDFGTGAIWVLGIPIIKTIIDKTVYPILKLNPDFDLRLLKDKNEFESVIKHADTALQNNPNNSIIKNMAQTLNSLNDKNAVLKTFKNKDLYKGLFILRFALSTALSAVALTKIIKHKQKTTQKRIEAEVNELKKENIIRNSFDKKIKSSNVYNIFKGSKNKQNLSFKGGLDLFMYNPIANTSILDGVIAATRLKEARKGERKEVALKELFQILFIYAIAKPTQKMFESLGRKMNAPIELDPKVLFSKDVKENIKQSSEYILKENLNNLDEKTLKEKIYLMASSEIENPLMKILDQNGVISIVEKNKEKALNYLKSINSNDIQNNSKGIKNTVKNILSNDKSIKNTINDILSLDKNMKNLKGIRAYKIFATIANLAIGVLAIGVIQPMLNIQMRKLLNNGDNRNPAIVEQEKQIKLMAQQNT